MNWLRGYGQRERKVAPPFAGAAPTSWSPGQTIIMAPCACCPHCGGTNVHRRPNSVDHNRWECSECVSPAWKMPETTRTTHARRVE